MPRRPSRLRKILMFALRRVNQAGSFRDMSDDVLYRRKLPHGPDVRIRRTTAAGVTPVTAVIDVDRRAGTPREAEGGQPPALKTSSAATEAEVVAALKGDADDDRAIASLLRSKGLR
jgi:hypothetical protein